MEKVAFLFFLLSAVMPCFGADKYASLMENAEISFSSGDYKKTIEIYESLAQVEKVRNPYLYYNMSNAYYRNGQLGKAVVNIEKAFILNPCDKDIKHNRQFLYGIAGIAAPEGFGRLPDMISGFCSLNAVTVFLSLITILILLAFSVNIAFGKKVSQKVTAVLVFLFILSAAVFALKVYREIFTSTAVSLTDSVVRSGPGANNPEIFKLPEGRIVSVENAVGGWSYVKVYPEGFAGWAREGEIERINE
jgi:tetratricopeptide (TPR) repeat protein